MNLYDSIIILVDSPINHDDNDRIRIIRDALLASWDSSWVVLRHGHFITCWSLRAAEFLFSIWAQHHTTSFPWTLIGDKVLSCIFFFQDVPGFWMIWWDNTNSTHKKKNQHLFTLPFRAVERFFHYPNFFNFSSQKKSHLETLGWLSPGALGWVGCGDGCGALKGNDLRLRPPPFWRWKKRRPLGRHVWSPKLSDEPNDLFFGGWKWSL